MEKTKLIYLDRAGILGLMSVVVFISEKLFFKDNLFVLALAFGLVIAALFFGIKDRNDEEKNRMMRIVAITVLAGFLVMLYFVYRFNII